MNIQFTDIMIGYVISHPKEVYTFIGTITCAFSANIVLKSASETFREEQQRVENKSQRDFQRKENEIQRDFQRVENEIQRCFDIEKIKLQSEENEKQRHHEIKKSRWFLW